MDVDAQRLELYKLAVEMADRVSARRATANSFFVAVNGALAAVVGLAGWSTKSDHYGLIITALAGITLSIAWWLLIEYYRPLNRPKFEVINEMENRLPEKPFTTEWAALKPEDDANKVTKRKIRERWRTKPGKRPMILADNTGIADESCAE